MQKSDGILTLIFLATSFLYLASLHKTPYAGSFLLKAIPALALGAVMFLHVPGLAGKLLCIAFVFCAAGDIALSFAQGDSQKYFIMGLGFFLIAQIFFIITYANPIAYVPTRLFFMVTLGFFSLAMAFILAPKLGSLQIPVFGYIAVLTVMGIMSALRAEVHFTLMIGALLFIISDSLIAVNKFLLPVPGAKYWIMVTYYFAIFLIARSFITIKLAE